jgi:hypothetical protein
VNGWLLPKIAARLRGVEIYHADAMDLIERFDGPETLFYIDPPYVHAARTARDAYKHVISVAAHKRLLDAILNVRGMVALSGYRNPLYDSALRSRERHEFEMTNNWCRLGYAVIQATGLATGGRGVDVSTTYILRQGQRCLQLLLQNAQFPGEIPHLVELVLDSPEEFPVQRSEHLNHEHHIIMKRFHHLHLLLPQIELVR